VEADGRRHTLIDKVPVFSVEPLDANSMYPRSGAARCIALNQWCDAEGRELMRISTVHPDQIESSDGLSEFVVLREQITAHPDQPA